MSRSVQILKNGRPSVIFFPLSTSLLGKNCLLNSVFVFAKESQILEIQDNEWVQVLDNWDWGTRD